MIGRFISLYDLLTERVGSNPEMNLFTFLDDNGMERKSLSYHELLNDSLRVASHLQICAKPGDRVLLLLDDQSEFITAFLGCLLAGMVAVPAQVPKRGGKESKTLKILSDCQPALVIGTQKLQFFYQKHNLEFASQNWLCFEELEGQASDYKVYSVLPEKPALIQYTSGTQGLAKGVVISHANIMANSNFIHKAMRLDEQKAFVSWLPHYHDMGLFGSLIQPVFSTLSSVLMPPLSFARRPVNWLKAISKYGATISGGPNFGYQHCVEMVACDDCSELDLSRWQLAYCGAEMVQASTLRAFAEKFSPFGFNPDAFMPCYGMAEATLMVSCATYSRGLNTLNIAEAQGQKPREIVSCGQVSSESEVLIVKDQSIVDDGTIGEIWYKGSNVSSGYWNNTEQGKEVFDQEIQGNTDFLKTGDLGFIKDGALYLTGRQKELIIQRGRNFYPQDIELVSAESNSMLRKGGVAAFSVEGVTEALVVLQEVKRSLWRSSDHGKTIGHILKNIFEGVGLRPAVIALLKPGSLPRTSSGKVSRLLARQRYLHNELEYLAIETFDQGPEVEPVESVVTLQEVQRVLMGLLKASSSIDEDQIAPNTSVFSMGLDSVAAVDLTVAIETRLNISLDASLLWQFETVEEISRYIYDHKICSDDLDPL